MFKPYSPQQDLSAAELVHGWEIGEEIEFMDLDTLFSKKLAFIAQRSSTAGRHGPYNKAEL